MPLKFTHVCYEEGLIVKPSELSSSPCLLIRQIMTIIDTGKDLNALFEQQVHRTPDLVALEDDSSCYTYFELYLKVMELGHQLRRLGVGRDSQVGVYLGRSADYVVACMAILHAGGAFMQLELAYPPRLLSDVLDDSNPAAVVTTKEHAPKIKQHIPLLLLNDPESNSEHVKNAENLPSVPADDDLDRLSFVSYSSGTTGHPKGIANPHRAPVMSYDLRFHVSDVEIGDRVACNVFFIWEIIRPLLRGGTVVAVSDEISYDPVDLLEFLRARKVTETLFTPTLLATILARNPSGLGDKLPDLKRLWLNGEVVTMDLARRALQALPNVRLLNCYSACETHEIACGDIREMVAMLDPTEKYCPVGPPLQPKYTYILDQKGHKAPIGTVGELYIGGPMLARGYLNRPETTALAFVSDPFDAAPGARMYRTGDVARILPNGLLEITGRIGAMIKLRGYSVVPGKVESTILEHLAVRHCAVTSVGDGLDRQLIAYIVSDNENKPSATRPKVKIDPNSSYSPLARRVLAPHLALYMIPTLWMELPELPTNSVSGKVDLKNLPLPTRPDEVGPECHTNPAFKNDRDPINVDTIIDIWASTLKVPRHIITTELNFFDLGGHSLLLAHLASRFNAEFGFKVPIARLVEDATVPGHLHTLRALRDGDANAIQSDLVNVLREDSKLNPAISSSAETKFRPITKAETILLTGVTGFLGAFLLNELVDKTSAHIVCLVRFKNPEGDDVPDGVARIRRHLLDLGLWRDSIMNRMEVLPADIAQKNLGMSEADFLNLADRIQVIVHAAATVNLVYPYAALRSANVSGTSEIIRLASVSGSTIHHISTNGVLPPSLDGWTEDFSLSVDEVPSKITDGYGQTKWVAEQLAIEAYRRAIPLRIFRLGTVSGHSTTGASNAWDLFNAIVVESLRMGKAPDVDRWYAEMTPVDFIASAVVQLADEPLAVDQPVFHLGNSNPPSMRSVFKDLASLGFPTEQVSWDDWVHHWYETRASIKGGEGAFTLDVLRSGMPSVDFLTGAIVLNDSKTQHFLRSLNRPSIGKTLLATYTQHWYARGWLPHGPEKYAALGGLAYLHSHGPLSGKVAVVTGASSGIGAAVAVALAREGCHVAIAARRTSALQDVRRRITVHDGRILVQETDVTDPDQVRRLFSRTASELGAVDIVVSCAGVMYFTLMQNNRTDEWDRTVDVNCKGLLHCIASSVPEMLSRGKGHFVAISSDAGRKVFPGLGVYSASKFFVEATLQSLRLETAGKGLRVTAIQPGNCSTDLLNMSSDQEAIKLYGEPSGARILDPENVAAAIVYALRQPDHVSVNEVLVEPRDEPI